MSLKPVPSPTGPETRQGAGSSKVVKRRYPESKGDSNYQLGQKHAEVEREERKKNPRAGQKKIVKLKSLLPVLVWLRT